MSPHAKTGNECLDNKISEWCAWNKSEKWRKEADKLFETGDAGELEKFFLKRMEFGTAGLRGRMGPGFSQMNDLVIIQTAQGLLKYLQATEPNLNSTGLVLGYDARHNSRRFAELTAAIFLRANTPVYLYSTICPTPFVPFAVTYYGCSAGVMVTASHNPKEDNGYKVYWSNGSQIIPPHDKGITKCILEKLEPGQDAWDTEILESEKEGLLHDPLPCAMLHYYAALEARIVSRDANLALPFSFTYTAMHGVGYSFVVRAMQLASFKELIAVKEQVEPDPEFPTVKYPNPEEGKSALDLSIATANANNSPIILANDPDADRLAVAEKTDGEWKVFTGNELGALLGWWEITTYKKEHPGEDYSNVYLLSSTVSSKILKTLALAEGFSFEETLTGFKWMGNRSYQLMSEGKTVIFAFEEAIGFMCGSQVLDKDGVSAAVRVGELAAYLYGNNLTLTQQLKQIYIKYGHHLSCNSYFFCHQPPIVKKIFDRLRNFSGSANSYPESIMGGKYKVTNVRDLTTGFDSSKEDKKATLPTSSSSQMVTFNFENGLVLTLRTSGTEPKIKYYTELCATPSIQDLKKLKDTQSEMVEAIIEEFLEPTTNGLIARSTD